MKQWNSTLNAAKKPMKRSAFKPGTRKEMHRSALKAGKKRLRSKQRAVTVEEKALWNRMATEIGCVACLMDGRPNSHVSIHHIDGRTKPGCHKKVLPLCAGHHQDGTGEDKTMIAVHPWTARFEERYGTQEELLARVMRVLGEMER